MKEAIDIAVYLAELAWAMFIADRILRTHYLPRELGFFWCFTTAPIYAAFLLTHPWGFIIALCGWPVYWLWGRAHAG